MTMEQALDMGREALMMALILSGPILLSGLAVGLTISLFQAVTQLQEQTLTFVPKIVSMVIAAMVFVPWIATRLLEYTQQMFAMAV